MALLMEGSVGLSGRNYPIDVAVIQKLLTDYFTRIMPAKGHSSRVIRPAIPIDGECDQGLIDRIKEVQTNALGMKTADGRIDPGGRTFAEIVARTRPPGDVRELLFGPAPVHTGLLAKVDPPRFRKCYIRQKGLGLTITKGEDLLGFFNFLQRDPDITDIRWAAYMLATVDKETGQSFKPNARELLKNQAASYANAKQAVAVIGGRGPKNAVYQNEYYGRGYVQITHDFHNKTFGKAYGIGEELYIHPDRAYEPAIAYFVASHGMRKGLFTNHSLKMHINGKQCNYVKARQIINGNDCDAEIAENALKIEILLRLCA